jgi:hypothetical protein
MLFPTIWCENQSFRLNLTHINTRCNGLTKGVKSRSQNKALFHSLLGINASIKYGLMSFQCMLVTSCWENHGNMIAVSLVAQKKDHTISIFGHQEQIQGVKR